MDDFLIVFGALWFVICLYAGLAYRIRGIGPGVAPQGKSLPWIRKETIMPTYTVSASAACYPRGRRRNSRQRSLRCMTRPSGRIRSSRG